MLYRPVARLISSLRGAELIGEVGPLNARHPFYKVRRGNGKKVLLLAGVHGDEPAGVMSLIKFFNGEAAHYEGRFEFTAFPCVNPWGFDRYRRDNGFGFDINREWRPGSPSQEVQLVLSHLNGSYIAASDLHEDMDDWTPVVGTKRPTGASPGQFFMWETCADKSHRVGKDIISSIEGSGYSVCKWPTIYEDINNDGVIWYPEDARSDVYGSCDSSDTFLIKNGYTQHAFTIETPRKERMEHRVEMNMITLRTILDNNL